MAAQGSDLEVLLLIAVATGARQGELLALRWRDIDLAGGAAHIRHTLIAQGRVLAEPKTESSRRTCLLPDIAVDALRRHRKAQLRRRLEAGSDWHDGDFVFCRANGTPMVATTLREQYRHVLDAAGLPFKPFHHLRHAYASLQIGEGEDLANISKALGHSSLSTTADIYAHLTPKSQKRMAETMDRVLAG
jgi:integrase